MTEEDQKLKRVADEAARKAVSDALLHLGIDVDNPETNADLKDDLAFLSRLNRGSREVKNAAIKTCVGAFITATIALMVLGIRKGLGIE